MLDRNICLSAPNGDAIQDGVIVEKEVIYVGNFQNPTDNMKFAVEESDIDNWVKQHGRLLKNGVSVPVPVGHTLDPEKRRGTVLEFSKREDSKGRIALFSKIEFHDEESAQKFAHSDVSLFSPVSFEDGSGNVYTRPITHVAITDYPVVNDLDGFIAASLVKEEKDMKMSDLAKRLGIQGIDEMSDEGMGNAIIAAFQAQNDEIDKIKKAAIEEEDEEEEDKPKPVAASLVKMVKNARVTQIDNLVSDCKISAAVGKDLKERYTGDKALQLSMTDDIDDGFDGLIETLAKNEPILQTKEKTNSQSLKLSADNNPLIADAERRAAAAK